MKKITDASGEGLFKLLKNSLEPEGLKMKDIIGESFDGAANMRGEYRGVQRYIKDISPNSIFMWCYSHVLNLCATDVVENIIAVKKTWSVFCRVQQPTSRILASE